MHLRSQKTKNYETTQIHPLLFITLIARIHIHIMLILSIYSSPMKNISNNFDIPAHCTTYSQQSTVRHPHTDVAQRCNRALLTMIVPLEVSAFNANGAKNKNKTPLNMRVQRSYPSLMRKCTYNPLLVLVCIKEKRGKKKMMMTAALTQTRTIHNTYTRTKATHCLLSK